LYTITQGALVTGDLITGALERLVGESVGAYGISLGSLAINNNYALTFEGAAFSILPRSITVTTAPAQTKIYGVADPAFLYSITDGSLVFEDLFVGALNREAGETVGAYAISRGTLALSGNYELAFVSANFSIVPRAVTVTAASGQSKVYGNLDPILIYSVTAGTLAFEDSFAGTLSRLAGEGVGGFTITRGTLSLNSNYALNFASAEFLIVPKAVTVTALGQTKTYGSSDPVLTFSATPTPGSILPNGHTISFSGGLTRAAGENVGTYSISAGNLTNSNYVISFTGASFRINPLAVAVTAEPKTKTFGDVDPPLTFVSSPTNGSLLANGSGINFTGSMTRTVGESIGAYLIKQGTLSNSNYTITFTGASFTIVCLNAPAIISYVTAAGSGSSSPPTVLKPSGTSAGNLLIIGLMYEKGNSTTVSPPSGWTLIRTTNQANNVGMATYFKVANSNEPGDYAFGLTSSPKWSIGISRLEGTDPVNPIDVHGGASGGKAFDAVAPSVTTTACNALVMTFFSNKRNSTWIPPVGTTEVYDEPNNQNGLTSNMMAYFVKASAGATGPKTATASINEAWVAQQVAVRAGRSGSASNSSRNAASYFEETRVEETQAVEQADLGIRTFPNPVRNSFNIILEGVHDQIDRSAIAILDVIGRSFPVRATWHSNESRLELDFSSFDDGLYVVNVKTTNGSKTVRVMKRMD